MEFKIGIIGMGVISKFYLAAFEVLESPKLVAVCDLNQSKLKGYEEKGINCYKDYKDLLKDSEISGVIINVPNDVHYQVCRDALKAGKHVCCEKPLTIKIEEAEKLINLSKETNKILFTAFHRRYNSNFIEMLKNIPSKESILRVETRCLEKIEEHAGNDLWYLQPERCGGGCIADNGPNVYDMLAFFLGRLNVKSVSIDRIENKVEIEAHVKLSTKEGIPIEVHLDWGYCFGEKKDMTIYLKDGTKLYCDVLKGYSEFKSSLYHEYESILKDFVYKISLGQLHGEEGFDMVRLVRESYTVAGLNC